MPDYTYLIIGGGMAAAAAITGIREVDDASSIGVITAEPHSPYDRPPLSKWLWTGKPLSSIWRKVNSSMVTFHHSRTAQALDAQHKQVTDDQGAVYRFSKLLLATGCTPRRLSVGGDQIIYYRTLDDYERVRRLTEHSDRFAIIGSGFIGSEMAAALAVNGKRVTLIFPDEAIGSHMYPVDLARSLNEFYRAKGIEVVPGTKVIGCDSHDGNSVVTVRDVHSGREQAIIADGIIAGVGVQPNVELAQAAGLEVDDGIRVNASLRTSHPDIYAAGDVASVYNPALNQWRRVEHEDNANSMGGYAGIAMTGRTVSYEYLPFFYSDFFDVAYEAVGEVDARLEMVEDWKIPCREGVVYYLREGRVRGMLCWNIYGLVGAGRRLIASAEPFRPIDRER